VDATLKNVPDILQICITQMTPSLKERKIVNPINLIILEERKFLMLIVHSANLDISLTLKIQQTVLNLKKPLQAAKL